MTLGSNRLNKNVVNHYNAENQLVRTLTKNYKVSLTYNAEGLRTSKTVNGEKTVFVWDGDQLVMELSEGGKVQKRYIRGNDLVYTDKGNGNASGEAYEKQYYVTDPHGNVVQLTDGNGKVTKTYEYDSFGNEVKPDEKDDNPFRYCGEYYDRETGEVYLRARYYQPEKGRFLTRDTYTGEEDEPRSLHLYAYCYNNPVMFSDAGGDEPVSDVMAAGIHIGKNVYTQKTKINKSPKDHLVLFSNIKGKVKIVDTNKLRVCTDGQLAKKQRNRSHPYGDLSHQNSTAYFGKKIWADKVPYIVIPVGRQGKGKLSKYACSVGVIIDRDTGNYLYCVVAENDYKGRRLGEVSIFAAWKMTEKTGKSIANEDQVGNWRIMLFQESTPRNIKKSKPPYGWKTSTTKLNKQIISEGSSCYWSTGKCLNDNSKSKLENAPRDYRNWNGGWNF